MADKVKLWFDAEADYLEVGFSDTAGFMKETKHDVCRRGEGEGDDVLQYSLEWGMFMRSQWGEYDTAVYDLERTWGRPPEQPVTIGGGSRPAPDRVIRSLDDVHAAIKHYADSI